ncbi:hypothetical protein DPMN_007192 [Dreissena polymorpha]|uniref:Uncharacterized protein n=1 Tax=Dreissena polymorpha TaxID=45954 RepID=A0A9D4MVS1_DREPO|nr:hypothetical protein DPMN_007192 [Dreissena polymorpha]
MEDPAALSNDVTELSMSAQSSANDLIDSAKSSANDVIDSAKSSGLDVKSVVNERSFARQVALSDGMKGADMATEDSVVKERTEDVGDVMTTPTEEHDESVVTELLTDDASEKNGGKSADIATVPVFACPCLLLLLSGAKIAFAALVLLTEVTSAGAGIVYSCHLC